MPVLVFDEYDTLTPRERELVAALLVYDATLHMTLALGADTMRSHLALQLAAAREAYLHAIGEESSIPPQPPTPIPVPELGVSPL